MRTSAFIVLTALASTVHAANAVKFRGTWWGAKPSAAPTLTPTAQPTAPTHQPTGAPTNAPTVTPPSPLHLLVFGDWGKGGLYGDITAVSSSAQKSDGASSKAQGGKGGQAYTYQAAMARAMTAYWSPEAGRKPPAGVLALGDNFYDNGVASTSDALWTSLFRNVYLSSTSPLRHVPWYTVLGNHDYGGGADGVQAQIDRTTATADDEWQTPAKNYSRTFHIPGGGSVAIVFIDSTTLAPSVTGATNTKGGVSVAEQQARVADQLQRVEQYLTEARAASSSWLLVAHHYPVYSAGAHGDTAEMVAYLEPLLRKYDVDASFSGHDHISEHLVYGGVHYFVAGAGALTDKAGSSGSAADVLWVGAGYSAFAHVAATPDTLTVTYVNVYGETVYEYTMYRQTTTAATAPAGTDNNVATSAATGGDAAAPAQPSRLDTAWVAAAVVGAGMLLTAAVVYVADAGFVRTGGRALLLKPERTTPGAELRASVRAVAARHSPLHEAPEPVDGDDNDSLIRGNDATAV